VYMQNFGDNTLEFRVDFWLDIRLDPNWQRVVSDIRVRIDELFREAGLVIAFPQRDVHLDVAAPIRVEWVAPAKGADPGSPPL
jgi:potassium efflux system protein